MMDRIRRWLGLRSPSEDMLGSDWFKDLVDDGLSRAMDDVRKRADREYERAILYGTGDPDDDNDLRGIMSEGFAKDGRS